MRRSRKEKDRLRVQGEAKVKFKPADNDLEEDARNDPVPDEEVKKNEREEKDKRKSKDDSISE
ncbi:hypothetical protein [Natribacillus halophilus]|uniref:Uncharacterized protein n=1 Tax=Natribacillus halophilus TaxID=549003 RepID=A0A1G8P145_9BACI|nr:hypothetical protein [Natribacillus halophilus]SDI86212.1 hypothetical protein SAMN04488123_107143 [Natribacillus halophilus]